MYPKLNILVFENAIPREGNFSGHKVLLSPSSVHVVVLLPPRPWTMIMSAILAFGGSYKILSPLGLARRSPDRERSWLCDPDEGSKDCDRDISPDPRRTRFFYWKGVHSGAYTYREAKRFHTSCSHWWQFSTDEAVVAGPNFPNKTVSWYRADICEALPERITILSANNFGSSAWTVTARIDTVLKDGTSKACFLKVRALYLYNTLKLDVFKLTYPSAQLIISAEEWWKESSMPWQNYTNCTYIGTTAACLGQIQDPAARYLFLPLRLHWYEESITWSCAPLLTDCRAPPCERFANGQVRLPYFHIPWQIPPKCVMEWQLGVISQKSLGRCFAARPSDRWTMARVWKSFRAYTK